MLFEKKSTKNTQDNIQGVLYKYLQTTLLISEHSSPICDHQTKFDMHHFKGLR